MSYTEVSEALSGRREMKAKLTELLETLIERMRKEQIGVDEGLVMTDGPPPYRRIDCGARALAYLRVRPTKQVLRVDVSGLWPRPWTSSLMVPSATGATTMLVKTEADLEEVVAFLRDTVDAAKKQKKKAA